MSSPDRPRPARWDGLPPEQRLDPLTKPVREAAQRPTPRWVGWVLIAGPTLAVLGFWAGPRLPLFPLLVVTLATVAAWDWWRYRDRSRTLRVGYLGLILSAVGLVTLFWRRPPVGPALDELVVIAGATVLALALTQLYRGAETVLTVLRGWLYLLAVVFGATLWQRLAGDVWPLTGPFETPGQLATAGLTGLTLMPLGFALEHDTRLRWAYPVAAAGALGILWWAHQGVALILGLAVVAVWLATDRRTRWVLAGVSVTSGLIVALYRTRLPWRWTDTGLTLDQERHLIDLGLDLLRQTWFLGAGPGGFVEAWPDQPAGLPPGPYSPWLEIVSQYGFGAGVVVVLAGVGLLRWCGYRLVRTAGRPWTDGDRAVALWCGLIVLGGAVVGSLQPTWLDVPLSALIVATVTLLARHVEDPHGRRATTGVTG